MITPTLKQKIQHLRPGTRPMLDFIIDDIGNGPRLAKWMGEGEPPTRAELDAVDETVLVAKMQCEFGLAATDNAIIRLVEDIYEVLIPAQKEKIPAAAKAKIEARKALRAKAWQSSLGSG